jgi:septal ring-binding cell division protein DamX
MERSVSEGKSWLIKSANNGSADAQYYLGTLYMNGHILKPDKENAAKLLTAAATQGHKGAKQALIDIKQVKIADSRRKQSDEVTKINKPLADPKTLVLNQSLVDKAAAKSPSPSSTTSQDQTKWLLGQSADKYTIQLIASQDKDAIRHYLKKLPKSISPFTYQFYKDKKAWMAVATGISADHGDASRAIKALPAKIRKSKPWIRNIGLLQDIISKDASIN